MRIVVYGFEPFGGDAINPSQLVARALDATHVGGGLVTGHVLPVETRSLRSRLEGILAAERPDVIVGVGLAPGTASLAVERVGVNVLDSRIPDNVGHQAKGEPIREDAPAALFATLPAAAIVERWKATAIPGYLSNSAGTFLCNQALYESLWWAQQDGGEIEAGFIHLPYLPGQAAERDPAHTPSMGLETMRKGLELAIETIAAERQRRAEASAKAAEEPKRTKGELWIPRGR
ncbi:MAG TPA: pyroglutamyl-peptidase I [Candidatus Dormibacteraeota bacterium]|nr:pyroglutamyl-peptidase I [Candidatus Dormibacteraeota bacterium]